MEPSCTKGPSAATTSICWTCWWWPYPSSPWDLSEQWQGPALVMVLRAVMLSSDWWWAPCPKRRVSQGYGWGDPWAVTSWIEVAVFNGQRPVIGDWERGQKAVPFARGDHSPHHWVTLSVGRRSPCSTVWSICESPACEQGAALPGLDTQ